MDLLNNILGGDKREEYDNFAQRYDHGAPWDDIDDNEALDRYRQVTPALSENDYRQSAETAFSKLTPQQRAEFGRWLQQQSSQRGAQFDLTPDRFDDPGALAGASARIHQQQPGLLEGLLGGVMGGGRSQAGIQTGGGAGDLLGSPIAKAVLAGVAATAVSKAMGRR